MSTTRALRRHHVARMKAKARRLRPGVPIPERCADNLKKCSCPICGNPRKWFKQVTRAERMAAVDAD